MAPKSRYALPEVFRLLDSRKFWFSARSRSTTAVVHVYSGTGKIKSREEAEAFICQGIRELTESHFCESVIQWGDSKCVADVYGLIFDDRPWYVKFLIDEEEGLEEISFHPPEKEMRTVGGMVIPKGSLNDK
jgi:hypothetical protein